MGRFSSEIICSAKGAVPPRISLCPQAEARSHSCASLCGGILVLRSRSQRRLRFTLRAIAPSRPPGASLKTTPTLSPGTTSTCSSDFTAMMRSTAAEIELDRISAPDTFATDGVHACRPPDAGGESDGRARAGRHECLVRGRRAPQRIAGVAGSQSLDRAARLLQCLQVGRGRQAAADRTGYEPVRRWQGAGVRAEDHVAATANSSV